MVEVIEGTEGEQGDGQAGGSNQAEADVDAERKRQAEAPVDDDDIRPWKLRKKTVSTGLGEIYDPGLIPIKIKAKKEEPPEATGTSNATNGQSTVGSTSDKPSGSTVPKWTAKGWNKPGEGQGHSSTSVTASDSKEESRASSETEGQPAPATEAASSVAKLEPADSIPQTKEVKVEDAAEVKAEETEASVAPPAQPLFKKRRGPAGTRSRR